MPLREASAQAQDPLPSWNDGKAKQSILAFVKNVTTPGSPDFVAPAELDRLQRELALCLAEVDELTVEGMLRELARKASDTD